MTIKINDKIDSILFIELSSRVYIIPQIKRFGYKKEKYWENIIFDIHFLFIKIYLLVWQKKIKKHNK